MIVNWGIIGCGDVVERRGAPAIHQAANSRIVAVTSRSMDPVRSFARKYNVMKCYNTITDLLGDGDVDAVYVATPPHLHRQHTIQCAKAGKHVLCEKPMAVNAQECREMTKVCNDNKVKLAVAYYRRFYPKIRKIKEVLEEGALGRIGIVRMQNTFLHNSPYSMPPREWSMVQEIGGGGCLVDAGSHRLDLLAYLMGGTTQVSAFTDTSASRYEVEDSASLIMKFENGARGLVNFNWNVRNETDDLEIHGDKGWIVASPLDEERLYIYEGDEVHEHKLPRCEIPHLPVIENFVKSINGESEVFIPGEEGIKASQIIDAAYESSRTERVVKLV